MPWFPIRKSRSVSLRPRRRWLSLLCVVMLLGGLPGTLQAAPPRAAPEIKDPFADKDYVMPWILVLLPITLGIIMVCRTSRRSAEVKRPKS